MEANELKHLRSLLQPYSLLYVEDDVELNERATVMFKKFFKTLYTASDGVEGLKLFKEHYPQIVITDITMPHMDGLSMAAAILQIKSDTKIIITTAHDERPILHRSIQLGVFDYINKPLKINEILETLKACVKAINESLEQKIFNNILQTIFNHQGNLLILLHNDNVVMANQPCLDFFTTITIEELKNKFTTIGQLLLEHNTFLYNHDGLEWYSEISTHIGKLFNIKIADKDKLPHHFVLTFQVVSEKEHYAVLSLNDVSDLGLLNFYDPHAMKRDQLMQEETIVDGLLELAMRSGGKIKVHNLYKELSITNDGVIISIENKVISLKIPYIQLKAIQLSGIFYLISDLFPMAIEANNIKRIDFDKETVQFSHYKLIETAPAHRNEIRVIPDTTISVTVLHEGRKFESDLKVLDISIKGVRLRISALPLRLQLNTEVILDMVITSELRHIIINTTAIVFRINEVNNHFEVIFLYDLHTQGRKSLIDYIAKRQLELIREFKGLLIAFEPLELP